MPRKPTGGSGLVIVVQGADRLTSYDNHVKSLELLQPNKTDVLPYLDGTSGPPERWARVVIVQGATEIPYVVTYMVCSIVINASPVL